MLHCIKSRTRVRSRAEITVTLKSLGDKIQSWRRYRQSVRELSQLSDRELADLGINRYDIETVAKKSIGV